MNVEIWSDVVCPWCYVGKRRFEVALSRFEHRDEVAVVWRSFELDPSAPGVRDGAYAERLAAKYRISAAEARAMIDRMVRTGAEVGLTFDFDRAKPGNTFDAHRLLHFARDRGVQEALEERLMAVTFTEGQAIGERDVLVAQAARVGLDADEARAVLRSGAFADDVRADEQQARIFGISSVPFFVVNRTYGVAGAQPPDLLLQVLEEAWTAAPPGDRAGHGEDGPTCADDVCALEAVKP